MRQKEYSFQHSKSWLLSGLHLYLSTLFDTNNETKRVLFPMLKMADIELSSFISKSTLLDTNNETNRVLFPILKKVDIEWCSLLSKYSF